MTMRTTITLDGDVAELVRKAMAERRAGLKVVVNDALRRGLRRPPATRHRTPSYRMGRASTPLDKALQLSAALEDEELRRRLAERR